MIKRTRFFVTFAPGHYGDVAKVLSSHHTYAAALKRIQDTTILCIRVGHLHKGERFSRSRESYYPLATCEADGAE